jgi:hypothetical protein
MTARAKMGEPVSKITKAKRPEGMSSKCETLDSNSSARKKGEREREREREREKKKEGEGEGKERKGKERKGKERKGKERKGKERGFLAAVSGSVMFGYEAYSKSSCVGGLGPTWQIHY